MGAWQNVHPGGIAVLGVKAPGLESLTLAPGRTRELALALQTVKQRLQWLERGSLLNWLELPALPPGRA